MFRALYEDEGFTGDPRQELTNYFQYSGPAQVLTNNAGMDLVRSGNFVNDLRSATNIASLGQYGEQIVPNIETRFQPGEIGPELQNKQKECINANIDNVIASAAGAAGRNYRCGWLYEKGTGITPKISKGWFGSAAGPLSLFGPTEGKWYWDVAAAKKQILTDRCGAMTSCEHLGSSEFVGTCGYCTTTGRGIPVTAQGQPLYNDQVATRCAPSKVITNRGACPPPPPPAPPVPTPPGVPTPRVYQVCDPLPGNRLRQDCIVQQAKMAGCTEDGALIHALATNTNPNDYSATLRQVNAFKVYQERSPTKFNEDFLRQGTGTINIALGAFNLLHSQANSEVANALTLAAQDLCTRRGALEQFDFCTEIADTQPPPFALDCLQKEFRKAGGQPAGRKYPTAASMNDYQMMPTYGAYKNYVRDLATRTKSQDIAVQEKALLDFLGIRRQTLDRVSMPRLASFEAFYFEGSGGFLGRRIREPEVAATTSGIPGGRVTLLMDLRPPREMSVRLRPSRNLTLTFNGSKVGTDCVTLKSGGDNKVIVGQGTTDLYAVFYGECGQQQPNTSVPKDWLCMTQDFYAPVLSFGVFGGDFKERRLPDAFKVTGGGYNTEIRESNTQNAPAGRPYITFTGPSSSAIITTPMTPSAFKTASLIFRINRPISTGTERILTVGNTEVLVTAGGPGGVLLNVNSYGANGLTGSMKEQIEMGRWMLLTLEQVGDATTAGFKVAIGTAARPDTYPEQTIRGKLPAGGSVFVFGKVAGNETGSAGMDILSFNLYDYSLTSKERMIDATNQWPSLDFNTA
jgi:hypothetical protein